MKNIEIITTGDGSSSLLNTHLQETYHSRHGAVQESLHVFIKHGLEYVCAQKAGEVRLFEMGFGTGLNALLTAVWAQKNNRRISFTTVESYPLDPQTWTALNFPDDLNLLGRIHESAWESFQPVSENFSIRKLKGSLQTVPVEDARYDLIYYDAFAPNKQPEMWTMDVIGKMYQALLPGGVFVTYCAKGQLKRDLKSLNFSVETLPGPPGKKEMVRATRAPL